jgi:glycosyltransferase involved in cell wall biosynthesis
MISIIIPTFNEEKEVERTVRQFEALKIPHEVIVSDTNSTDQTVAIAQKFADRVLTPAPGDKPGVAIGRNHGGMAAKGDLIVFLDASSTIPNLNRSFEKIVQEFAQNPKLVGLSGRVEVDPSVRWVSDWMVMGLMNVYYWALNNIFHFGIAMGKLQVVRAEAFREVHGFDETLSMAEDMDFFTRLSRIGRTRILWHVVVYYSGRRFHQAGPWRTLYHWIKNAISFWLFKKPSDKKWDTIR